MSLSTECAAAFLSLRYPSLNSQSHQSTNEFINLMLFNSMYPLISKPTRITSSTATQIDNIFTNNLEQSMSSGILYTDLSDHLPTF